MLNVKEHKIEREFKSDNEKFIHLLCQASFLVFCNHIG